MWVMVPTGQIGTPLREWAKDDGRLVRILTYCIL